ncbi:MAG: imidazole glycerol phosphate synthase subunit HisF [Candidatus Lokiarchaeota archaeon]|nr:imidazole glycerol phosphate synthase subunit HisF [Candidatus Lokiarchaeota archaeon]
MGKIPIKTGELIIKTLIPAMDIREGKVIRLTQGDFSKQITYSNDPIAILKQFIKAGALWIHVVNLDGALTGEFRKNLSYPVILDLISHVKQAGVKIQIGGGIRSSEIVEELINKGTDRVILGTIALDDENLLNILSKQDKNKIAVALDTSDRTIRTKGWQFDSNLDIFNVLSKLENLGIRDFIVTDIMRDGTSSGLNTNLFLELMEKKKPNTKIIASGGVSNISDVEKALRYSDGVIVGKALYNGSISLIDLGTFLDNLHNSRLIKRIIPCLDVKNGRVVKGVKFKNLRDSGDPVELARFYNDNGADELVFLDISATLEGRKSMLNTIRLVAEEIFIPLTVGGGIKTIEDMTEIIRAGAEKVSINSAAINDPNIITEGAKKFGSQCIVVAIDAKKKGDSWEVYSHSGTKPTGLDVLEWAKTVVDKGAGELLVTSMDRDGTNSGYDLELTKALTNTVSVPVIASGGAGNKEHFLEAINNGAEAVLAASLFHFNILKIQDLKEFLDNRDVLVRI